MIVSVCTCLPYVGYSVSEAGAEDDGDLFAGECHLPFAVFEVFVANAESPCGASADDVEREFVGEVAPIPHTCAAEVARDALREFVVRLPVVGHEVHADDVRAEDVGEAVGGVRCGEGVTYACKGLDFNGGVHGVGLVDIAQQHARCPFGSEIRTQEDLQMVLLAAGKAEVPLVCGTPSGFDVEGIETVGVSRVGEPTEGEVCPTHVEPLRRAAEGLPPLDADADLHAVVEQGAEALVLLPHAAETQREHILMGIDMRCVGSLNRRDERANEKKAKTD